MVGHDHLGHGESVTSQEKLGFFHETDGNAYVIGDIHELRLRTQKKYPGVPYFMMGHSMGSFLLRQYIGMYGEGLNGAIIMGTGQKSGFVLRVGKMLCTIIAAMKGWDYRSQFINNMAFGGFNRTFESETNGSTWLSRNPENAINYSKDPLCSFVFTINAYYHMFCGIQRVNRQEREGRVPKSLPVFFVAGQDDPVGKFGKSVENVYKKYRACGIKDVAIKLYKDDRHEILNETDRENIYADIYKWLEKRR